MTDSAIGGVPTSGRDAAGDGSRTGEYVVDDVGSPEELAEQARATAAGTAPTADVSAPSGTDGAGVAEGPDAPADGDLDRVSAELAERTADLQRVSAEYANYRRRIDRERETTVAGAKAQIAAELLTVLDDVERAAAHGDLTGPFKVVAEQLTEILQRAGLTPFGAEGDPFDPAVHEAVAQETSSEVSGPTVSTVMRRGYRFGEKVLRPAMVAVADRDPDAPEPDAPEPAANAGTGAPAAGEADTG